MPGAPQPNREPLLAPWLPIPCRAVSVVEHPCVVKNVDQGIRSLGGPVRLSKGLRAKADASTHGENDDQLKQLLSVSLRPDDPFAKRLLSTAVTTNNLLLKVTTPRRTGRRRRRGSSAPFLHPDDIEAAQNGVSSVRRQRASTDYVPASHIYRALQDNPAAYKVSVAGLVDETHRFRTMPDLQYSATYNDTMLSLRNHILPARYSEIANYKLNTAAGSNLSKSVGPSAEFMQMPIAYNYRFQQNTFVKYTDEGVVNLQRSLAHNSYMIIKPTDEGVPSGPKTNLPPEASLTPYLQTLIAQIKAELHDRPIITRHLLYNKLGWDRRVRIRQAAVYCGYFFESGPWREALVAWGVDPRKDAEFRKYQTVSFMSYLKSGRAKHGKSFDDHVQRLCQMSPKELKTEHIFDGHRVSTTGNLFQFCDLTDPLLARILATKDIRHACAPTFQGWYHVGTWAKVTVILKHKMNTLIAGHVPNDALYERVVAWPELWDDKDMAATYKSEIDNREIHEQKREEHDVMHNVRWAARNPRYAFEKMEATNDQQDESRQDQNHCRVAGAEEVEVPEDMTEEPDTAANILNEGEGEAEDPDDDNEDDDDVDSPQFYGDLPEIPNLGDGEEEENEDENDDEDIRLMSAHAASEGPAPFGGLYRGQGFY
ncbi:tau 95 subunit of transcription factor TFIIIC [Pleosporales sp. CAS-2024a]